ncbi:hypothetical protein ACIQ4I_00255 [Rummeliibacillus sp. NPDC094406]|uniref:hypothetical protein n=1 Tax=Rummeliibacillus sp. NPDC094406 TaxID=3364511 RepID=UPI003806ECC2
MKLKSVLVIIILSTFLASCSKPIGYFGKCPDAIIEWVDVLMIHGIKYEHHFPEPTDESSNLNVEKGKKIGEVLYKMADNACNNHKMKNGDAAFIEKGTAIYEVNGYPSSFLVLADNKVYVSHQNKKAKTAKELYPLKEYVQNIYIESTEDGRRLHTFSSSSRKEFIEAWDNLIVKDVDYTDEPIFLEIELKNGVTFRLIYSEKSNVFTIGVMGNEKIKEIIQKELQQS